MFKLSATISGDVWKKSEASSQEPAKRTKLLEALVSFILTAGF
jgi:hypothetical protein